MDSSKLKIMLLISCSLLFEAVDSNGVLVDSLSTRYQQLLKRMITLNKDFKKSVSGHSMKKYQALRKKVEQYQEDTLSVALPFCVEYIAKNSDSTLAVKFMKMLICLQNSADETLPYALGVLYYYNSKIVESTIEHLPIDEKRIITGYLDVGWEAATYEKKYRRP